MKKKNYFNLKIICVEKQKENILNCESLQF